MNPAHLPLFTAALLALAAAVSMLRLLHWQSRRDPSLPPRHGRLAALLLAQPLLAALLYLALFPPAKPTQAGTLTVLTAGAPAQIAHANGDILVALPEAPAHAEAEAVPDLATALRRHPQARRLHVVGAGLEARDREAARGRALVFDAAPPPAGLVDLEWPAQIAAGNDFAVHGRLAGLSGAAVELLDPAGQRLQRAVPGDDGRFALQGAARAAGRATFSLRVVDASGATRETMPLPLRITAPAPPRLLVLAGAPGPELKYLRRWASDAGIALHTRIGTGAGLVLGDAPLRIDADTLRRFDALLLDERSLQSLGDGEMRALSDAVREGLGVLLRMTGPLSPADRARLRGWGFGVDAGAASETTRLREGDATLAALRGPGSADAPLSADEPVPALPSLTRRALRIEAADAVPLLHDAQERPLAYWRAHGRGRIALVTLTDSFKLVLAGRGERHAGIWSEAIATVARGDGASAPPMPWPLWEGERATLCDLADDAGIVAPDGARIALHPDPAGGARRCAAFWPAQPGWHLLRQGEAETPFAVLPAQAGAAWQAQRRREATLALAAQAPADVPVQAGPPRRGPSWPWFLAWLLASASLWAFERRRRTPSAVSTASA